MPGVTAGVAGMVKTLEIENFKSIKHLSLNCKRFNIFIGEPNTGKSNILETLALASFGYYFIYVNGLRSFVRFERTANLFYDENLEQPLQVRLDDRAFKLEFKDGRFIGTWEVKGSAVVGLLGDHSNLNCHYADIRGAQEALSPFKLYRFPLQATSAFGRAESDFLLPPSGDNLMSLLLRHRELRTIANEFFAHFGLSLGLRLQQNAIEVIKLLDDVIVFYPYSLSSDTLQRLVFHTAAIISNKDSVLILEEPESHAFPYYTKYLAEMMALEEKNNQFFVSTHNPYFLRAVLEKSPQKDIAIFVTYIEDYQTKAKLLSPEEMEELLEIDPFFNLDRFLAPR